MFTLQNLYLFTFTKPALAGVALVTSYAARENCITSKYENVRDRTIFWRANDREQFNNGCL